MINSIYARLFAYRERENRSPLEDYLSEILRCFLNEMGNVECVAFCKANFVPEELHDSFETICFSRKLYWNTQKVINHSKRLDLVLEVQDLPIIVVESKISSSIGVHKVNTAGIEVEQFSQLYTYGFWQHSKLRDNPYSWPGILVFLTHKTLPPSDFGTKENPPYKVQTEVAFWSQIFRSLQDFESSDCDAEIRGRLNYIANSFAEFLKFKGMGSSSMKPTDLAAVQLFMHSGPNVEGTISEITSAVVHRFGGKILRGGADAVTIAPNKTVSGWKFLKKQDGTATKTCIWWGIRFAYGSDLWNDMTPPLLNTTSVFVAVAAEGAPIDLSALMASVPRLNWSHNQSTALLSKDIMEFSDDPDKMSDLIKTWVSAELDVIVPAVIPLL